MRRPRLEDINTHCLEQFRSHWKCLDNNNHQYWQCRPDEWKLNRCVFEKIVCYLGWTGRAGASPAFSQY
jgi:hypothetical protein